MAKREDNFKIYIWKYVVMKRNRLGWKETWCNSRFLW